MDCGAELLEAPGLAGRYSNVFVAFHSLGNVFTLGQNIASRVAGLISIGSQIDPTDNGSNRPWQAMSAVPLLYILGFRDG